MTPETWKKIGNVVIQALALEGQEREHFLQAFYEESPALRPEVEAMLDAYAEDQDFLESPVLDGLSLDVASIETEQIGPYRIIRRIGQGGMGEVYLAQREDSPVSKPVALKVIRTSGSDTDFLLVRFQIEQQILAELNHPHIARLLDAGSTETNRPYFVMEFVDGLPITEYCDKHQLPVDERLKLFVQACQAVQFAHQNFIVHRDLKPGNILVTREGHVKLLDFGIAKALDPWKAGIEALETRTGFRVLTPPYASPEQVQGKAITTASDVYSLGILLYELLTGRRPYQLADKLEAEVVRVIAEETPSRPSDAITHQVEMCFEDGTTRTITPEHISASRNISIDKLQRKLKGELDNIVLMALRKEANRRYGSAAELGADIRRHLEGQSVEAQPDTLGYRLGKFVSRHRWAVAASTVFFAVITVFTMATFFQSLLIREQAAQLVQEKAAALQAAESASQEADKADEVVDILVGLFELTDPNKVPGGDTVRVGTFLQRNERRVIDNLEDRPAIQARMRHVIGQMYYAQGDQQKALQLMEAGLDQQIDLLGATNKYGAEILVDLAMVHYDQGRRDTTIAMLRTALERFEGSGADAYAERASTLLTLAPMLSDGQHEEQAQMLEEANALLDQLDEPDPMTRASAANQLGVFYHSQGEYAKSLEPFETTRTFLEQAVGKSHRYYLITTGNLAGIYQTLDRLDEAEALHTEVLTERRKRELSSYTNEGLAWTLTNLGTVALMKGNWDEAVAYKEEAFALYMLDKEEDHQGVPDYALSYAEALLRQGHPEKASLLFDRALRIEEQHHGSQSAEYAWALYKKASLLAPQQQADSTQHALQYVIDTYLTIYPDGQNSSILAARQALGVHHIRQGDPAQAYQELSQVLAYRNKQDQANPVSLNLAKLWTGVALSQLGRHDEAGPLLEAGRPLLDRPFYMREEDLPTVQEAMKASITHPTSTAQN